MKISTQLAVGLAAVVGLFALTGLVNVAKVRGQAPLILDITTQADKVAAHNVRLLSAIKDMERDVVQVQQWLSDISATRGLDGLDDGFKEAQASADSFRANLTVARAEADALALEDVATALAGAEKAFAPYHAAGIAMAKAYVANGPAGGNPLMANFDDAAASLQERMDDLAGKTREATETSLAALTASAGAIARNNDEVATALAVSAGLGFLVAAGVGLGLSVRLRGLFALLTGDVETALSDAHKPLALKPDRTDELGPVAHALETSRRRAHELAQTQIEQQRAAALAAEERFAALQRMADAVEAQTVSAVEAVVAETDRMQKMAAGMAASAMAVDMNSQSVASAAEEALSNSQAVAGSAETLSTAIRDIGSRASASADVVAGVVAAATEATKTVERLSAAMGRIDQFAKLIADIASQTNLLALNATIEAARAGAAGKGFAVVAGEVKNLASQTSKSTEEISREVTELREVGGQVARSIRSMSSMINEVNDIARSIADAVKRQDEATGTIAQSVVQTSHAAEDVSAAIARVAEEASITGERAMSVNQLLETMSGRIHDLRIAVNRAVRSATPEVNRRHDPRVDLNSGGELILGEEHVTVKMSDVSLHGSRMVDLPKDFEPHDGALHLEGLSRPLPFHVVECSHGMLRVSFDEAAAEHAGLTRLIAERNLGGRAA